MSVFLGNETSIVQFNKKLSVQLGNEFQEG